MNRHLRKLWNFLNKNKDVTVNYKDDPEQFMHWLELAEKIQKEMPESYLIIVGKEKTRVVSLRIFIRQNAFADTEELATGAA